MMMSRLDRGHLRITQKNAYVCCAKCFDGPSVSDSQLANCVKNCQQPSIQNGQILQRELQSFQARLERCGQMCQDDAQQNMTLETQQDVGKMESLNRSLAKCSVGCLAKSLSSLPSLENKIVSELKK